MSTVKAFGTVIAATLLLVLCRVINLEKRILEVLLFSNIGFVTMLVFMVTKDDYDRYGIWKTLIGNKQPSITEMLEFGKWAVFKPIGILVQATIIDFNTEDDALESNETTEIASQYASTSAALINHNTAPKTNSDSVPNAPPPPPVPPPLPTTPNGNDDVLRCKKISWKELKIDTKNTIWDKVNRSLEHNGAIVDKKEILELFKEKPRKSKTFAGHSVDCNHSEGQWILTGKKKLNISIALAHHQLNADDLIKSVTNVDVRLLEADFLSTIENFLPDQQEEASLIQKYSRKDMRIEKDDVLADPEEFSFLLASIPQFRKRIHAMVFQCSFFDRVNAICKNFDVVRKSIREIRESKRLETFLMYILSTGKTMNNTATKAFNIDFLQTTSCCKTSDGSSNFLTYVASKIELHDPQMLKLSDELPSVGKAEKVSLIDVDRDCTELAVEYSSIAMELDSLANDCDGFKEFLTQGKLDLNNVKRKRRQIQQELSDLAQYFGIDPMKTKPTELFSIFKQFLTDLSTAIETLAKRAHAQKTRQMSRTVSVPTFRRTSRNSSFRGSRNSSTRSSRNSSFRKTSRRSSVTSSASDMTFASTDSSHVATSDIVVNDCNANCSNGFGNRQKSKATVDCSLNGEGGIVVRKSIGIKNADHDADKTSVQQSPVLKRIVHNGMMTSEDDDFTSKREMLRKVLLSPVRERRGRGRMGGDDIVLCEEKTKKVGDTNGCLQNGVNERRVAQKQDGRIEKKSDGIGSRGRVTNHVGKTSKSYDDVSGLNGDFRRSEAPTLSLSNNYNNFNNYDRKLKDNLSTALSRSSSLRRSNKKPKRVSVKSMHAKELQKIKRFSVSKSESNLSSKAEIQSVVLKPGFIEKLSPMKSSLKDMNNNNNIDDNNNNDDDDVEGRFVYQKSATMEKDSKYEEKVLRRTKRAERSSMSFEDSPTKKALLLDKIQLRFIIPTDIDELKTLCKEWFPIDYPEGWYKDVTLNQKYFALAATLDKEIIGTIIAEVKDRSRCNKEDSHILGYWYPNNIKVAYILILGVRKQYRRYGIGNYAKILLAKSI
eukprot:gene9136-10109_t